MLHIEIIGKNTYLEKHIRKKFLDCTGQQKQEEKKEKAT